jgi:ribosomal protein S18 acetylase RimI-like enzyme
MTDDPNAFPLRATGWLARRLADSDAPLLQRFFDANPTYAELAYGHPWPPDEAERELKDLPPAELPQGRTHFLGIERGAALRAFVSCTDDLLAPGVFHLGFLIVDEAEQGSGLAQQVFDALIAWAVARGALYLRLGVLAPNERGARFWQRQGLVEVKQRPDTPYGALRHTVRVLVKPLSGGSVADYLSRVARDRPEIRPE